MSGLTPLNRSCEKMSDPTETNQHHTTDACFCTESEQIPITHPETPMPTHLCTQTSLAQGQGGKWERGGTRVSCMAANEGLLPCLPFFAGLRVNRLVTSRALWSPAEIFHLWTMLAAPALPTRTAPSRSSTPTRRPPRRASWRSTPGGPPPRPSWPRRTPSSSTRRLL
jgi:hypothetical protein